MKRFQVIFETPEDDQAGLEACDEDAAAQGEVPEKITIPDKKGKGKKTKKKPVGGAEKRKKKKRTGTTLEVTGEIEEEYVKGIHKDESHVASDERITGVFEEKESLDRRNGDEGNKDQSLDNKGSTGDEKRGENVHRVEEEGTGGGANRIGDNRQHVGEDAKSVSCGGEHIEQPHGSEETGNLDVVSPVTHTSGVTEDTNQDLAISRQAKEEGGLKALLCPRCAKYMKDSHRLPCGHILCRPCLRTLSGDGSATTLYCPQTKCSRVVLVPAAGLHYLPTAGVLSQASSMMAGWVETLPTGLPALDQSCGVCEKGPSTKGRVKGVVVSHRCDDCDLYLCGSCYVDHSYDRRTKAHVTGHGHDGSVCCRHGNQVEHYCHDCSELICYLCDIKQHGGHNKEKLANALSKQKSSAQQLLGEIVDIRRRLNDNVADIDRVACSVQMSFDETADHIKQTAAEEREAVDKWERHQLDNLAGKKTQAARTVADVSNRLKEQVNILSSILSCAAEVHDFRHRRQVALLYDLNELLQNAAAVSRETVIEDVIRESVGAPTVGFRKSIRSIQPGSLKLGHSVVDKRVTSQQRWTFRAPSCGTAAAVRHPGDVVLTPDGRLVVSAYLNRCVWCFNVGRHTGRGGKTEMGHPHGAGQGPRPGGLEERVLVDSAVSGGLGKATGHGGVPIEAGKSVVQVDPGRPDGPNTSTDSGASSNHKEWGMLVGGPVKAGSNEMQETSYHPVILAHDLYPLGLRVLPGEGVVVGDGDVGGGLLYVEGHRAGCTWMPAGTGREASVRPVCVARLSDGSPVILCSKALTVYVYGTFDASSPPVVHIGGGVLTEPHYMCVNSEDQILVSDQGEHCVFVFDRNGQLLLEVGAYGQDDGRLDTPKCICLDDYNNILVADEGNDRISVFDSTGVWKRHLVEGSDIIGCPHSVAYISGDPALLAVTCRRAGEAFTVSLFELHVGVNFKRL